MGPASSTTLRGRVRADVPAGTVVYATAKGSNVIDVDGNRYVDLAAGFGAMLLGHAHPRVHKALELQSARLLMALGDVHPADAKIALTERLARLHPERGARALLAQSGSDAVTAALKTAVLATSRPGILAFAGAYHGLGYGPLAACGLRESYRAPFGEQLNAHIVFVDYPRDEEGLDACLERVRLELSSREIGAVLVEPILGRGGCIVPPPGFLADLSSLAHAAGALVVADEIWTGLGRSGSLLFSVDQGATPDLVCLGKGLGGGLPISACVGSDAVMRSWQQPEEVVHTSTFAGAPLACTTALATLDVIKRERLVERSREIGGRWRESIRAAVADLPIVEDVRGAGLMVALDLGDRPGHAVAAAQRFLERGYLVSTGGGRREVIVLTPALTIAEDQLDGFVGMAREALQSVPR